MAGRDFRRDDVSRGNHDNDIELVRELIEDECPGELPAVSILPIAVPEGEIENAAAPVPGEVSDSLPQLCLDPFIAVVGKHGDVLWRVTKHFALKIHTAGFHAFS